MNKQNNFNFDMNLMKAIGIITIVASHCHILFAGKFFPQSSWEVPLFFFVSGYFFNFDLKSFIKKIKKYVSIYYLYHAFYAIITVLLYIIFHQIYGSLPTLKTLFIAPISYQPFSICAPAWFLSALIMTSCFFYLLMKLFNKINNTKLLLTLFTTIAIIGICLSKDNFMPCIGPNNGLLKIIVRTFISAYYMYIGYLYRVKLEKHFINNASTYISIFILVLAQIIICYATNFQVEIDLNFAKIYHNISPLISPIIAICLLLYLVKIIPNKIKTNYLITQIGKQSLHIMMNHIFVIYLIQILIQIILFSHIKFIADNCFNFYELEKYKYFYLISSIFICVLIGILLDKYKNHFNLNKQLPANNDLQK